MLGWFLFPIKVQFSSVGGGGGGGGGEPAREAKQCAVAHMFFVHLHPLFMYAYNYCLDVKFQKRGSRDTRILPRE